MTSPGASLAPSANFVNPMHSSLYTMHKLDLPVLRMGLLPEAWGILPQVLESVHIKATMADALARLCRTDAKAGSWAFWTSRAWGNRGGRGGGGGGKHSSLGVLLVFWLACLAQNVIGAAQYS